MFKKGSRSSVASKFEALKILDLKTLSHLLFFQNTSFFLRFFRFSLSLSHDFNGERYVSKLPFRPEGPCFNYVRTLGGRDGARIFKFVRTPFVFQHFFLLS